MCSLLRDYFSLLLTMQPLSYSLSCSLLRDYFDAEFKPALAGRLPFAYDLERIVDDFVLFCMLVGVASLRSDAHGYVLHAGGCGKPAIRRAWLCFACWWVWQACDPTHVAMFCMLVGVASLRLDAHGYVLCMQTTRIDAAVPQPCQPAGL